RTQDGFHTAASLRMIKGTSDAGETGRARTPGEDPGDDSDSDSDGGTGSSGRHGAAWASAASLSGWPVRDSSRVAAGGRPGSRGSGRDIGSQTHQPGRMAESAGRLSEPATATVQTRCRAAAEPRRSASAARAADASTTADLADDTITSAES